MNPDKSDPVVKDSKKKDAGNNFVSYKVKSGDSLYTISKKVSGCNCSCYSANKWFG